MRLPGLSYAVESVLGAAVVVLAVVVVAPDPWARPKPVAKAADPPPPPRPAPVPPWPPIGENATLADAEWHRDARARNWAGHVAERGEKIEVTPKRREEVWATHLNALRAETRDVFDTTPGRAAKWAGFARSAMDARARLLVEERLAGGATFARRREDAEAKGRAVDAGCDDPLVLFWHAAETTRDGLDDPAGYRAAVERLYASPYPPARRLPGVWNWLLVTQRLRPGDPLRADAAEWEGRFWELYEAVARARTLVGDEDLIDYAERWQGYRIDQGRSRVDALAEIDRRVRRAGGRDFLRRTVRGAGLVRLAWEARGSGTADTVAADAWEVFRGHLREAREVLTDACEDDPDGYTAPARLVSVCVGLGAERQEMEDAFRRAMFANPDNCTACYMRLEYLHPKWHGSRDGTDYTHGCWSMAEYHGDGWVQATMLSNLFANQPMRGPRFEADRVMTIAFYGNPDRFHLVWTACRVLEAARPEDKLYSYVLARIATMAREFAVARSRFERVGPLHSPAVFVDQAEYDQFRREAGITP